MSRYTHHCSVCDTEATSEGVPPCHPSAAVYLRKRESPSRFEERVAAVEAAGGLDVTVLASSVPPDGIRAVVREIICEHDEPECPKCASPKASVAYIQRADGRILCVWNHTQMTWGLPGGKAEPGEDFADAMERELKEETGLIAKRYVDVFEAPSSSGSGRMVRAFAVEVWRQDGGQDFDDARQIEVDSPVAWLRREDLLKWSKFEIYYRPMFAAIDARSEPQEGGPPAVETGVDPRVDGAGAAWADASAVNGGETARAGDAPSCGPAELELIRAWVEDDDVCHTPLARERFRYLIRLVDNIAQARDFSRQSKTYQMTVTK